MTENIDSGPLSKDPLVDYILASAQLSEDSTPEFPPLALRQITERYCAVCHQQDVTDKLLLLCVRFNSNGMERLAEQLFAVVKRAAEPAALDDARNTPAAL
ncbi:MAG: hypothetical protein AAF658_14535 [Myxococcota bacterium]